MILIDHRKTLDDALGVEKALRIRIFLHVRIFNCTVPNGAQREGPGSGIANENQSHGWGLLGAESSNAKTKNKSTTMSFVNNITDD